MAEIRSGHAVDPEKASAEMGVPLPTVDQTSIASEKQSVEVSRPQPPAQPVSAPSDLPPEEGLRGWLCVVGGFFSIFCTFGLLNS